jgi:dihydropteroate synthase-like protein
VPWRRAEDLREIPAYFGGAAARHDYGAWDIEIVAEINNARAERARRCAPPPSYFRASGADIIDIGCTPGSRSRAGDVVRELVGAACASASTRSIPDEIRTAVGAGAELVLSVNGRTSSRAAISPAPGARRRVPDLAAGSTRWIRAREAGAVGRRYLIDPILEPIGFGFMASLERYAAVRRRYPDAAMLMGIGNLTELTAADSTGVNALLVAICQELGVRAVLTTEVIPWARGAVREVDIARRLMHYAVTRHTIPKGVDDRLVTVKDPAVLAFSEEELRALQTQITDPNFRIFADREGITVLNNERFVRSADPGRLTDLFTQLEVTEPMHAFYLGRELARASLAVTLGKTYRQEGALSWGYLTTPDEAVADRVRLTQRSKPKPPA